MTTTLTPTKTQSTTTPDTQADGYFDAVVGLPPVNTQLGSDYYRGYIAAVIATGNTPF